MTELFNGIVFNFGSSSAIRVVLNYEKRRTGADMEYRFNYRIYISNGSYYQNNVRGTFTLNDEDVWVQNTKSSATGWSFEYTSDWFTVENKVSGTTPFKFTIKDTQNSSWCNYTSSTFKLDIDPAGSDLQGISNFNIGTPFTVLTTKYAEMYDVLTIKIDNTTIKTIEDTSTSNTINFTSSELSTIYNLTKNVQSQDFTFELKTYEDSTKSTQVGVTKSITAKGYIIASSPAINSLTAVDINPTTIALTGSSSKIVKYSSNVKVTVNASGVNGATIKSITINGVTAIDSQVEFTSATVNTFNVIVTDSRGFSTPNSITLEMVEYIPLTASINVNRNTPTDGKVIIDYSGNYYNGSFGKISNTLLVYYRFKEKTGLLRATTDFSEWISLTPTITNNTYSQNIIVDDFDYTKQYEFEFKVEDELNVKTITGIGISKGIPIIWWDEDLVYIYNKEVLDYETVDENSIKLMNDRYWDSKSIMHNRKLLSDILFPIGYVYVSEVDENPNTFYGGTWEQIEDVFLLACGKIYPAGSTGGEATHTLTIDEMPEHNHEDTYGSYSKRILTDRRDGGGGTKSIVYPTHVSTQTDCHGGNRNTPMGGGLEHNNMPPYKAFYMWKRVA